MQYLFDVWDKIVSRIKASKRTLLLFDYDGTLTPIVERPEFAILSEESRKLLECLSVTQNFKVGIVSGRALSDLREKVKINGLIYAGNHGLEIEGPGLNFIHPLTQEVGAVIRVINKMLDVSLSGIRGAIIEDKGLTLSIHYRLVDNKQESEVKGVFERVVGVARALGKVRVTSGKKVYEVRPNVPWDKGKAVKLIMKKHGGKNGRSSRLLPIYVGDDLTDEDAFEVIGSHGGITIYVGDESRQSAASYHVKSPFEVNILMQRLVELK